MNESTETLIMFAQLLEANPPILRDNARQTADSLAADLESLSEQQLEQAAEKIITWMSQFPQEIKTLKKTLERQEKGKEANRKEFDDPIETTPQPVVPNFQIIEQPDGETLITPVPPWKSRQPIPPVLYIRQTLSRWIRKPQ